MCVSVCLFICLCVCVRACVRVRVCMRARVYASCACVHAYMCEYLRSLSACLRECASLRSFGCL